MRRVLLMGVCVISACVKRVNTADSPAPCRAFEDSVAAFNASLIRPDDAPPRSDPQRSPPLANAMAGAAARCLQSRGISIEKTAEGLVLSEEAPVARELARRTGGRAIYSPAFFLSKPYAAAAFDKSSNALFVPHAAVVSDAPNFALLHELQHVGSLQLLRSQPRRRHWLLQNASTEPDALGVDEIFAYAATSLSLALDEPSRQRSLSMARRYAQMVRAALDEPSTLGWIETHPKTEARPLDEATRRDLRQLLECVDARLPDIEACDAG